MESQEQETNPEYLKGFNNGYLLAQHEPKLAAQLSNQPNDHSEYFSGFISGKEQYTQEVREWSKSFSRGALEKGKDAKDLDRDR